MPLVMVVDDDQDLAEMLSIVLTGAGMEVDLVTVSYTHLTLPTILLV